MSRNKTILITGGAGFIGVNASAGFAREGWRVHVLDNLSRRGTPQNLAWLRDHYDIAFDQVDIRDSRAVDRVMGAVRPDAVLHLAGQVAVTTSVQDPREDFEINALGTFNMLDAVRRLSPGSFFINAATNKVFGRMEEVGTVERGGRYEYRDLPQGVDESQPLDFHSPYGCSKGVADQYTIDFARIYGLKTVTMRQSCIYGPHQFGIEDQGWVAWFIIAAVLGQPMTIYGDGKQIRDLLYVDDLVACYKAAIAHQDRLTGGLAFNIGGGPSNTLSLLELVGWLERELGRPLKPTFSEWRPGDQPVFMCNIDKARRLLEWSPRIGVREGTGQLLQWIDDSQDLLKEILADRLKLAN